MTACYQFEPRGDAQRTLERHLPEGHAWIAWRIVGKTAYRLMTAIARAFDDASQMICKLAAELDPRTTTELIGEWETAVSLPDPCLPQAATLAERRTWVMWRLAKRRWTKVSDWEELAALFGLEIVVVPGWIVQQPALYPMSYPRRYDRFPKLGRFRVYINFRNRDPAGYDYGVDGRGPGYPVPYGIAARHSDFKCLIERVKPANVIIIWDWPLEHPSYNICVSDSFAETFAEEFC